MGRGILPGQSVSITLAASADPAITVEVALYRVADGLWYDFAVGGPTPQQFAANPTTKLASVPALAGMSGFFLLVQATNSHFTDGDYYAFFWNATGAVALGAPSLFTLKGGSDVTLTIAIANAVVVNGSGSRTIDHNYGGTDALRFVAPGGQGVAGATVWAYLAADYAAGNVGGQFVQGQATTGQDGRWLVPMSLDPGSYELVFFKLGQYTDTVVPLTVS